jgi:hypothetical protein
MLVVIAVLGVLVLGGFAVWIGLIEGDALEKAWRRLADARRGLVQREFHLSERESRLDERERAQERREAYLDWLHDRLRGERDE